MLLNAPTSQEIVDAYNETCVSLPRVRSLTEKRKRDLKARLKKYSQEELKEVFKKAEDSDFLSGRTDKWTGATFDWLIKEENIVKVLEGNYDNRMSHGGYKQCHDIEDYKNYNPFDDNM